jgi:hypothetical protein
MVTRYSPFRHFTRPKTFTCDLHASSTPPTFALSQDQTLQKSVRSNDTRHASQPPEGRLRSHDEWFVLSFGLRSSSTDEASRTPPKGPTLCSALLTDSSQASFSQEPTEFSKIRHSARAELTLLGPPVLVPLSDSALRLDSSRRPSHRSFRADSVLPAALGSAPLACEGCQVRRERAAKTTLRLAPVKTP